MHLKGEQSRQRFDFVFELLVHPIKRLSSRCLICAPNHVSPSGANEIHTRLTKRHLDNNNRALHRFVLFCNDSSVFSKRKETSMRTFCLFREQGVLHILITHSNVQIVLKHININISSQATLLIYNIVKLFENEKLSQRFIYSPEKLKSQVLPSALKEAVNLCCMSTRRIPDGCCGLGTFMIHYTWKDA